MLTKLKNYVKPKTLKEAVKLLNKDKNSAVISGGTDLFLFDNSTITTLVDISGLKLFYIKKEGKHLKIGATGTFNEMAKSLILKKFANGILAKAASSCAYNNIRNLATIGGNIASSLSSADLAPALLALEAKVKIEGRGKKFVSIDKFFVGHRKNILKKEIITEVIIPAEHENSEAGFIKFSRTKNDISTVNCACLIEMKNNKVKKIRIALGCCGPTPKRIYAAEKFLTGKHLNDENIKRALNIIEKNIKPLTDHRASAEYRSEIAKELFLRILK